MIYRTAELMFSHNDELFFEQKTNITKFQAAIGYLVRWNLEMQHVRITLDAMNLHIQALYYKHKPNPSLIDGQWPHPDYRITTIWHDDHFGYRSRVINFQV